MAFVPAVLGAVSAVSSLVNSAKGGQGGGSSAPPMGLVNRDQLTTAGNNVTTGLQEQQNFMQALKEQNGIGNQQSVFGQQQNLANQFQNIGNGTGPNPALAQLNQATGHNVANQAALMAGQRGSSANAGLIARQAAQQGGNLQQQAVGQGATLQAQQQLAGLQALQGQQGMMAGLAGQQVGQQQASVNAYNQEAQQNQSSLFSAAGGQNQAAIQNAQQYGNVQNAANANSMNAAGQAGGLASGLGGAVSGISNLFGGGGSNGANPTTQDIGNNNSLFAASGGQVAKSRAGAYLMQPMNNYAAGGYVDAMVSPGERYLPPSEVQAVERGKKPAMKAGEKISGKAKVKGDSLKNDTVPKKLKEGGIVLPKSVTEHPNAGEEAKKFVMAILAKKGLKK